MVAGIDLIAKRFGQYCIARHVAIAIRFGKRHDVIFFTHFIRCGFMDPVSPLPAILCLLLAVATAFLLMRKFGAPPVQGRFASIDGLRGYLAFFVFLHHASIWFFYLRTGKWVNPPSNLYSHFGLSSVLIFFMITGFLFFSKLIDGRTRSIDWGRLYISRFLRLAPLYLFVMLLLFCVVAYLSGGILNEPIQKLLSNSAQWLGFTILGAPNLNGIGGTLIIVAGVTWSLPYEWLFYFSLPLLALTVRVVAPLPYIAVAVAGVTGLVMLDPQFHSLKQMSVPLLSFIGGIIVSFLVRSELVRQFAARKTSSFIVIGCLATAVTFYPIGFGLAPVILLFVAFAVIACGNTLFGILVSPTSRTLGEMAYSIYLIHGISLFITFSLIVGQYKSREISSVTHWLMVAGITPVLIFVCFITFRFIESPAMRSSTKLADWIRLRLTAHS